MLFRSEEDIATWAERTGNPVGEALSLEKVWELSKLWYHNRLSHDFRGRTAEDVQAIFNSVGLRSSHWKILP